MAVALRELVLEEVKAARHAAADDEALRVGHARDDREGQAQAIAHERDGGLRGLVAGFEGIEERERVRVAGERDRLGAEARALIAVDPHHAFGRGVLLEAAAAPAAALERLGRVHGDVAYLAGGAVGTGRHLAVHDHAAAHARAERDEHAALEAARAALPELAQRGRVGIVHVGDRGAGKRGLERSLEAQEVQVHVGHDLDVAISRNGGRHGEADATHVIRSGLERGGQLRDAVRHRPVALLVDERRRGNGQLA